MLYNKLCLISQAERGLGREIALIVGAVGSRVLVQGNNKKKIIETSELVRVLGSKSETLIFDSTQEDKAIKYLDNISKKYGCIDIFVNSPKLGVNSSLLDQFVLSKVVFNQMVSQGFGHLINIVPMTNIQQLSPQEVYRSTRQGLLLLDNALFEEGKKKNVTVTTVITSGEIFRNISKVQENPEQIAEAILYLLTSSQENSAPEVMVLTPSEI